MSFLSLSMVTIITGCSKLYDDFMNSLFDIARYHKCSFVSCSLYEDCFKDILFFNYDRDYSGRYYDSYKIEDKKITKIDILSSASYYKDERHHLYFRNKGVCADNYFFIFDCLQNISNPAKMTSCFLIYDKNLELVKEIYTPFVSSDSELRHYSVFSRSGYFYYRDKISDNKYCLYRFNLWEENIELVEENIVANTFIKDESDIVFIDSALRPINLTQKKVFFVGQSHEMFSKVHHFVSFPINDAFFEVECNKSIDDHRETYLYYKGELVQKFSFKNYQNCLFKAINNDIFYIVQDFNYNDTCKKNLTINGISGKCICQFYRAAYYKYSTTSNSVTKIRDFEPESYVIDFDDKAIIYYYNGFVYRNDETLFAIDLKINRETEKDFLDKSDEYFLSSATSFLVFNDSIYCYDMVNGENSTVVY